MRLRQCDIDTLLLELADIDMLGEAQRRELRALLVDLLHFDPYLRGLRAQLVIRTDRGADDA